jgi:hypothetical protein
MRSGRAWILVLTLTGSGLVVHAAPSGDESTDSHTPRITGRWKLDPEKSDDARARMRAAREEGQGDDDRGGGHGGRWGGRGTGRGMGGGSRGGRVAGHQSEEERAAMRDAMDDVMQPADVLTITQGEGDVTIARDDGRTLRLYIDGRKAREADGAIERTTRWDGPRLVSEIKVGDGPKITESWWLAAEGKQLQASIRLQMPRGDREVVINRVYDSAPPE